jgi:hypothetical protein
MGVGSIVDDGLITGVAVAPITVSTTDGVEVISISVVVNTGPKDVGNDGEAVYTVSVPRQDERTKITHAA